MRAHTHYNNSHFPRAVFHWPNLCYKASCLSHTLGRSVNGCPRNSHFHRLPCVNFRAFVDCLLSHALGYFLLFMLDQGTGGCLAPRYTSHYEHVAGDTSDGHRAPRTRRALPNAPRSRRALMSINSKPFLHFNDGYLAYMTLILLCNNLIIL